MAGMAKPWELQEDTRPAVCRAAGVTRMQHRSRASRRGADRDFGRLQRAVHAKGAVEQPGQDCLDYPVPESGYESSFKTTQVVVPPACCCSPLSCPSAEVRAAGSSSTSGALAVH